MPGLSSIGNIPAIMNGLRGDFTGPTPLDAIEQRRAARAAEELSKQKVQADLMAAQASQASARATAEKNALEAQEKAEAAQIFRGRPPVTAPPNSPQYTEQVRAQIQYYYNSGNQVAVEAGVKIASQLQEMAATGAPGETTVGMQAQANINNIGSEIQTRGTQQNLNVANTGLAEATQRMMENTGGRTYAPPTVTNDDTLQAQEYIDNSPQLKGGWVPIFGKKAESTAKFAQTLAQFRERAATQGIMLTPDQLNQEVESYLMTGVLPSFMSAPAQRQMPMTGNIGGSPPPVDFTLIPGN